MATEKSHDSPSRDPNLDASLDPNLDPNLAPNRARLCLENRDQGREELDSESRATVEWRCFDAEAEVVITERNRPHWDQAGAVTFVTMRLADSIPKTVLERWRAEQQAWLRHRGLAEMDLDSLLQRPDVPRELRRAFTKFRNQRWNENLDASHGACLLRHPENAAIVADAFMHFDGERYDLERFVIMPNHVHVLMQMRSGWELRAQCESWMRYTARQIHARMRTTGPCWAEPFDHIVRNAEQFEYLRQYIVANPVRAQLRAGEFVLWIRGVERGKEKMIDSESRSTSHDSPSREAR